MTPPADPALLALAERLWQARVGGDGPPLPDESREAWLRVAAEARAAIGASQSVGDTGRRALVDAIRALVAEPVTDLPSDPSKAFDAIVKALAARFSNLRAASEDFFGKDFHKPASPCLAICPPPGLASGIQCSLSDGHDGPHEATRQDTTTWPDRLTLVRREAPR